VGQYVAACAKDECGYFGEYKSRPLHLMCSSRASAKVPLERFYDRQGPIRCYARRGESSSNHAWISCLTMCGAGFNERVPSKVIHVSADRTTSANARPRPLKRSYAMMGTVTRRVVPLSSLTKPSRLLDINANAILQRRPAAIRPSHKTAELLAKLDARERPGISERDFVRLFYKCECGVYVTRRAFLDHRCLDEIIELTDED
jgi:hypothetical protein